MEEKETRLLIVADLNRLIASNDKTIVQSKDSMEKDMFTKLPCEIDRWYKATNKKRIYSGMIEHIETDLSDFNDSIEKYISKMIEYYKRMLLSGRLVTSSTSMMHNLCSLWVSESLQDVIRELEWIYSVYIK
jgi:hypothetical protein